VKPDLQTHIQRLIDGLVTSGAELGVQVAAYVEGSLVVDAWAGVRDAATGRLVDGATLFTATSMTKGVVTTCLHLLADRGRVDYDAPVATYWPEFAAHGKAGITVRQVLAHTAGIPHLPVGVTATLLTDWDAMCAAIARLTPLWPPGTTTCYHAWTWGWIIGEIVHRVDGRPLAEFARAELCQPLGIADCFLGLPSTAEARVAPLQEAPPPHGPAAAPSALARQVAPPEVVSVAVLNRPEVRRAVIPSAGGIMTARAIARHYAMLAGDGMLNGIRLLSAERIAVMRTLQTEAPDAVSGWPVRRALGYVLLGSTEWAGARGTGRAGEAFGHAGYGGTLGFADPARKLSFGLTKNLLKPWLAPPQSAGQVVAHAIRQYLDAEG
jgi:CubicO group peptidase (beta-lactamase class C family)